MISSSRGRPPLCKKDSTDFVGLKIPRKLKIKLKHKGKLKKFRTFSVYLRDILQREILN
jgi:hypothetical protein